MTYNVFGGTLNLAQPSTLDSSDCMCSSSINAPSDRFRVIPHGVQGGRVDSGACAFVCDLAASRMSKCAEYRNAASVVFDQLQNSADDRQRISRNSGLAIACRLSVCLSVCDVGGS